MRRPKANAALVTTAPTDGGNNTPTYCSSGSSTWRSSSRRRISVRVNKLDPVSSVPVESATLGSPQVPAAHAQETPRQNRFWLSIHGYFPIPTSHTLEFQGTGQ